MKNAPRVLVFAFGVMLLSAAAYADPQAVTSAPNAAPATTSGTTSNGNTATPRRHGPCKADVQNFCSSVPKGNGQILTCLKAHVGQLSPRCEAAMKRHANQQAAPAAQSAPVATPSSPASGTAPGK